MPTSQPVLLRALRWGILATIALVVVFGGIGWLVAEGRGLTGGAMGAAFAGVFLLLTVGSIAFANRFVDSPVYVPVFFGIVMGAWLVKFIGFIVALLILRGQPWLDPRMFFFGLLAGVIVSLVIDVLVVTKSRIPYVSDPR
ncbi:3-oxoacyl-ACP reductase [Leucobacter triazinivorans]|uniref:3-oxoacyl-ACP reductase n=2 Tax=Leucobacter triazinivorans TaxID=1784719 RepID=A0A4P6KJ42_9MICO|nr:3-oxoacyl-ACP reductase [Leucobacter triazinivorans]